MRWSLAPVTLAVALAAGCTEKTPTAPAPPAAAAAPTGSAVAPPAAAAAAPAAGAAPAAAPALSVELGVDGLPALYDLVANRPAVVVHRDGALVIEAGTPDVLKYVDGGWKSSWLVGQRDGERRVAAVAGLSATLRFPLDRDEGGPWTAGGDLQARVTVKPLARPGRCSVFLNEQRLGDVQMPDPGYATYTVTLPQAHLKVGENALRFYFRGAVDYAGGTRASALVERIAIAAPAAAAPAAAAPAAAPPAAAPPAAAPAAPHPAATPPAAPHPAVPLAGAIAVGGQRRRGLRALGASRLSYYLELPAGTSLTFAYGASATPVRFAVRVAEEGKPAADVWSAEAGTTWQQATVDLGRFGGKTVRLDLVTAGAGGWAAPRLLPAPKPPATRPRVTRVIVWMIDTLRADKLTVYNPSTRVKTPNLTAWAKGAVRIEWPMVPGTWSMPSHASLLTGLQPPTHGAVSPKRKLPASVTMISEQFKQAGFTTAMFSANGYVSDRWGFKQGWDHYRNFIRESLPNTADYVWKTAKPWFAEHEHGPLFVYLATVDPHVIYNPKPEFAKLYFKGDYKGPIVPVKTGLQMEAIKTGRMKLSAVDKQYLEALHDAEITQNDHAFGQLLTDLKAMGMLDDTVVVVVSDHGDEFFEHGSAGHGHSTHQELVWVPLMFAGPGLPAGKVVHVDADMIDAYSTMLDLAGVKVNPEAQGESLVPLMLQDGPIMPRAAFSWMGEIPYVNKAMKLGRWKLINWGNGRIELYDVPRDLREQSDVAAKHPFAVRRCRNVFGYAQAYEKEWKKPRWGTPGVLRPAFADDIGL